MGAQIAPADGRAAQRGGQGGQGRPGGMAGASGQLRAAPAPRQRPGGAAPGRPSYVRVLSSSLPSMVQSQVMVRVRVMVPVWVRPLSRSSSAPWSRSGSDVWSRSGLTAEVWVMVKAEAYGSARGHGQGGACLAGRLMPVFPEASVKSGPIILGTRRSRSPSTRRERTEARSQRAGSRPDNPLRPADRSRARSQA
jgi:hypothetical protein